MDFSDDISKAISRLVRKSPGDISAYIDHVCQSREVDGTKTESHFHFIQLDGNKRPRVSDLVDYIVNLIVDYSIPRSEIEKAKKELMTTGSTASLMKLQTKAKGLFADVVKTGEGGELLLYTLVQKVLNLPQLICKMPLKTNSQLHYNGADGVHVDYDKEADCLALYWGESKLYADLGKGLSSCFESLAPFLISENSQKSPQERDIQLISDHLDLADDKLQDAILDYFDKDHRNFNKLNYRGVCLIGFDVDHYPNKPNQKSIPELQLELNERVDSWVSSIKTQVTKHTDLSSFHIHAFLVPFPSVADFRDKFREALR